MKNKIKKLVLLFLGIGFLQIQAQQQSDISYKGNDSVMVTVFMRHFQENPVDTIQTRIMKQKFYEKLSKSHAKIQSWNVVMGIDRLSR